ncbi:MAG: DUF2807 domain-containing protein [Dehalococcoidales bacterium]|jgi:hypothetical protein
MNTQRFDFTDFTRLRIERALSVDILREDTYSLTIGDDFSRIRVEKVGETLVIGRRGLDWAALFHPRPHVVVTMPELEALEMSGSCQGKVIGFHSDREFSLKLSGASHLEINRLAAGGVKMNISGASDLTGDISISGEIRFNVSGASRMELSGSAASAFIELSGASQARLANLTLQKASLNTSGASSVQLNVKENLDINLSGASRLEYAGRPALGKIQIAGASVIKQR